MNDSPSQTEVSSRRRIMPVVLREVLLVAAASWLFALAANQISPRGLSLTRNYFPTANGVGTASVQEPTRNQEQPSGAASVTNPPAAGTPTDQLKAAGLQPATGQQVIAWLADPRRQAQKIIFVDARNEEEYLQGHLPGAWLFNPYEPEKYFPAVVPACQAAEQIVIYCHGADCDDSVSAATLLKDVGISSTKIFVYAGGMSEWATNGQPLEIGPQNSGKLSVPPKEAGRPAGEKRP